MGSGAVVKEPRVVELDYGLGGALWGLGRTESLRERLLFEGGKCLRKCYIPDYHFSEDLPPEITHGRRPD